MTKRWRPHVDLARLSAALAAEILAATEQEVRDVSASSGFSLSGSACEVRKMIDVASDEQGRPGGLPTRAACLAACVRQH